MKNLTAQYYTISNDIFIKKKKMNDIHKVINFFFFGT